ncbi:MAG TPA: HAD hydrolase family protein [Syntrophomonadaceae bacterium]|nr:HAD hydrolase family protein [Syntrophomonadaceae bacterium]
MIKLSIPGQETALNLTTLLLDVNGTITVDGELIEGTTELIDLLKKDLQIYLLTADTHGRIEKLAEWLDLPFFKVSGDHGNEDKLDFMNTIDPKKTVAIGNGYNDSLMLEHAALSIAIIGKEGASSRALQRADVVVLNIIDALELLLHPLRLVATLRR